MSTLLDDVLQGIVEAAKSTGQTSSSLSNNTKGSSRENFIRNYLKKIIPDNYRFGSGEVIDSKGNSSGQVDIVIENVLSPSFPLEPTEGNERLYIAEGVGAIIEVKSDIKKQWNQVESKIEKISRINRKIDEPIKIKYEPKPFWQQHPEKIPFYLVGFKGPKDIEDGYKLLISSLSIFGILSIDPLFFCSRNSVFINFPEYGVSGLRALWAFAAELQFILKDFLLATPPFVAYLSNEIYVTDNSTGQFVRRNLVK
jgi:hypothetical protein